MIPGGQKAKGNAFETKIAKQLSSWITFGQRFDVLDRSPSSGAKATNNRLKSNTLFVSQAGDIIATEDVGYKLTKVFMIECKHVADLNLEGLIYGTSKKTGIAFHWSKLCEDCILYEKEPMLIARQNNRPILLCLSERIVNLLSLRLHVTSLHSFNSFPMCILYFSDFLENANPSKLDTHITTGITTCGNAIKRQRF